MNLNSELAALSTFRKLCNDGKDVYDVIEEFILYIIVDEGYHFFDTTQIYQDVNKEFNLDIPSSVIKDTIKRMIHKNIICVDAEKGYESKLTCEIKSVINLKISDYKNDKNDNDTILDELLIYLKDKVVDTELNKEKTYKVFRSYLLGEDDFPKEDNNLVSAVGTFILLKTEKEDSFTQKLDSIKSSIIIKDGLFYNNDIIENKFNNLNIYLDMEIMFDAAGYNGLIYKNIFDTFINYIEKLKSKGSVIHLKYLEETHDRFEEYFKIAHKIFEKTVSLSSDSRAMVDIVNGCKNRSDLIEKESDFFQLFEKHKILIDYTSVYENEISNYPITFIDKLNKHETLYPIQYLNVLRRSKQYRKLSETSNIFLTRTSDLLMKSRMQLNEKRNIPIAVNPDYIVNKFWVASGDGLGNNIGYNNTVSFVQRILSEEKRYEINKEYEKLQKEKNNENKDDIKKKIIALRTIDDKPENITSSSFDESIDEEISDLLKSRENLSYEEHNHKETLAKLDLESEKRRDKDKKLRIEELKVRAIQADLDENKKAKEVTENKYKIAMEIISNKTRKLQVELDELVRKKRNIDNDSLESSKKIIKNLFILTILSFIVFEILLFMIVPKNWNILEPYTFLISPFPIFISYLFLIFFGKTFNPIKSSILIKQKIKQLTKKRLYKKHSFSDDLISKKEIEINELSSN